LKVYLGLELQTVPSFIHPFPSAGRSSQLFERPAVLDASIRSFRSLKQSRFKSR
jgi:hypothetical protein